MDPGIVAEAIQAALASAGVTSTGVVTAVGGRDVIIKKIQIERVKEAQARELMRWEAEQHVPFDMESVELDFQILDPDGDDSRVRRQASEKAERRCVHHAMLVDRRDEHVDR